MTNRKYNEIKKLAVIGKYHRTFDALLKRLTETVDTDRIGAAKIAAIIDLMYGQKIYGESDMYRNLR